MGSQGPKALVQTSSEQRCRKAYERYAAERYAQSEEAWLAWVACWKYLERNVIREFIQR